MNPNATFPVNFRRPFIIALMTDEHRLADPLPAVEALPPGIWVIFRHYGAPDREALANRLAATCARRHLPLFVAGDPDLATRVGAAGLHLPEWQLKRNGLDVRLWRRRGGLVSVAVHGPSGLAQATRIGADAALLSPVFATASHPGRKGLGVHRFAAWSTNSAIPVLALGGIRKDHVRRLQMAGATGVAGIGGVRTIAEMAGRKGRSQPRPHGNSTA